MPGIDELVKGMKPPRYTTKMASEAIGVSEDTISRWRRTGIYRPSEVRNYGKVKVPLYSKRDLNAMGKIKGTLKPGRKKST